MNLQPATAIEEISCQACGSRFDGLTADLCSCLVSERTLVCPRCSGCFCAAPREYRMAFFRGASPALRARWHRKPANPFALPAGDPTRRPLVLIVDDEPYILGVAAHVVARLGYGTLFARDGRQGLELARLHRPDLVLTDALMPGLDGREMGAAIKADPATRHAIVVVMTSLYTGMKHRNEALHRHGLDEYLAKPVDLTQLRSLLGRHLGGARN